MYPILYIHHNHGTLILGGFTIDAQGVAQGTILGGGSTSRLFHATLFTPEPVGKPCSYPLYRRIVREKHASGVHGDEWVRSPTPGLYEVDVTFCG